MDLIERQAAIEAICKACSMEGDYHKCDGYPEASTWCDYLVALRALPSVPPEIIRCKDCRYWGDPNCPIGEWRGEYPENTGEFFCANGEKLEDEP